VRGVRDCLCDLQRDFEGGDFWYFDGGRGALYIGEDTGVGSCNADFARLHPLSSEMERGRDQ
jgi:hypothetical protein